MLGRRLLIVDDEDGVRSLVRMALEPEFEEILEAPDADAALALAREHHPDVVLLDVEMPGTSGLAVSRLLKEDPATADIAVVMLTAKDKQWDREWGDTAGADGYLTKPFSPGDLPRLVGEVLRGPPGSP